MYRIYTTPDLVFIIHISVPDSNFQGDDVTQFSFLNKVLSSYNLFLPSLVVIQDVSALL